MDQLEVELSALAGVGYRDLPGAAGYIDTAELYVTQCNGMSNRRIFDAVDQRFADLRDLSIRTSLRRMQQSLESIAEALRIVHARYGGADQSSSHQLLQADLQDLQIKEDRRDKLTERVEHQRDIQEHVEEITGSDIYTADEIAKDAREDALTDTFIPFRRD